MALSRKGDCKMKKFLALICMVACVFGMTACAESEPLTQYEQQKVDGAINRAENVVIPAIQDALADPTADILFEYTPEEVEYTIGQIYDMEVDGVAFVNAVNSFASTYEEIGGQGEITGSTATIDDKQIIVNVDIVGPNKNARAEIVFSNDFFLTLESASLSKVDTMSDAMGKAGMNTLLGMGTVFTVLILISLIISSFGFISKVQSGAEKKTETKAAPKSETATSIEKTVAQIAQQEERAAVADDTELIAVIAAAIAASQGQASTDGFVVRSIKRRGSY